MVSRMPSWSLPSTAVAPNMCVCGGGVGMGGREQTERGPDYSGSGQGGDLGPAGLEPGCWSPYPTPCMHTRRFSSISLYTGVGHGPSSQDRCWPPGVDGATAHQSPRPPSCRPGIECTGSVCKGLGATLPPSLSSSAWAPQTLVPHPQSVHRGAGIMCCPAPYLLCLSSPHQRPSSILPPDLCTAGTPPGTPSLGSAWQYLTIPEDSLCSPARPLPSQGTHIPGPLPLTPGLENVCTQYSASFFKGPWGGEGIGSTEGPCRQCPRRIQSLLLP